MKVIKRSYPMLSACGLNCGLCPRFHTEGSSKCPGCCGEGFFGKRPSCGVISCSHKKEIEYCFECEEYPCKKLIGTECVDSFITHRNMRKDFEKAKKIGIKVYQNELNQKIELLELLLEKYNDGRKKSFYCIAVNLLELSDSQEVIAQLEKLNDIELKEKAKIATELFQSLASRRGIELVLNKKK